MSPTSTSTSTGAIFPQPVNAHISIGSLDDTSISVDAQYNPKELQIQKTVPWQKHQKPNTDGLQYEFTGAEGRTMSVDFLFDGFEEGLSIAPQVASLEKLATVRDAASSDPEKRRPHHCVVAWGTVLTKNSFQCVITQITAKYTMFSTDGAPLRATVTLQLQEATRVTMASPADQKAAQSSGGGDEGDEGGGDEGEG